MADLKSTSSLGPSNFTPARVEARTSINARSPVQTRPPIDETQRRSTGPAIADPAAELIADFVAPSSQTSAWLTSPKLTATLEAASKALAPNGATEDPIDRYAASVVETHLVARRRLSSLMNSLLKT